MIRRILCWLGGHDYWLFATLTGRLRKCIRCGHEDTTKGTK